MEHEKETDIRVPLVFAVFSISVVAGGVFLVLYVFVPGESRPWYPMAALVLIGSPWIFWLLTFMYTCIKGRFRAATSDNRQISRRPTARNASSVGTQQASGAEPSVASSKEPEMPLTHSV